MEIRSFSELGAPKVTGRTVEGYAVVFNHESKVLFDKANKRFFIEIIEDGAITEELLRSCDILYNNKVYYFFSSLACSMYLSISIDW